MQNPEPFLRFLAVQNPQMAQAFTANPEVLVQLLAAVGDSEGEEHGPFPSAQAINVPGEDRAAIEQVSDYIFAAAAPASDQSQNIFQVLTPHISLREIISLTSSLSSSNSQVLALVGVLPSQVHPETLNSSSSGSI
jgi:hypothetical protein